MEEEKEEKVVVEVVGDVGGMRSRGGRPRRRFVALVMEGKFNAVSWRWFCVVPVEEDKEVEDASFVEVECCM